MITRQIGKRRRVKLHAIDAILIERVRGYFHRDALRPGGTQRLQTALQRHGIGRGVRGRRYFAREAHAQGTHVTARPLQLLQCLS